jgi:SAM-dependent methyltransferase
MFKNLKRQIKSLRLFKKLRVALDNQFERDEFVIAQLNLLPKNSKLLDAGSGSQRYRQVCDHLDYRSQDFGQYTKDNKEVLGNHKYATEGDYPYGAIDYISDIWNIPASDASFDCILCTEVLEHIPYPNETIQEFSRLLKPGGKLILTAPSNCLRHMDPYYFYSGFSDRWYETILPNNQLKIEIIKPVGDYYRWLAVEMSRTALSHSFLAKILLLPAFLFFYNKPKSTLSIDTLCMGYLIVASKS